MQLTQVWPFESAPAAAGQCAIFDRFILGIKVQLPFEIIFKSAAEEFGSDNIKVEVDIMPDDDISLCKGQDELLQHHFQVFPFPEGQFRSNTMDLCSIVGDGE